MDEGEGTSAGWRVARYARLGCLALAPRPHPRSSYIPLVAPRPLPLFILPLVLLPGAPLPLHVFEPRYRQMLADCLAGDRRFGLVFKPDAMAEDALPAGHVGCVAVIEEHVALPEGKANLLVRGAERFALVSYAPPAAPYHVGFVEDVTDEPEPALAVAMVADDLRALFARTVRTLRPADGSSRPAVRAPLPEDDHAVAFAIATLLDLDPATRQRVLASRSSVARLRLLHERLARAVEQLEVRAAVVGRAVPPDASSTEPRT